MTSKRVLASKILLPILSCFCVSYSLAAHTLYQGGDALNSTSVLVSKNGLFTLGFVRIGTDEINASYLGIWYNYRNVSYKTAHPFWLANRDKPIADNSGVLAIDGSGNMKLTYSNGTDLVDFYSSRSTTTNLTAVLEDSGNFVLKDANSGRTNVRWQSFDSPTDSFLPGMKLGVNRRTGQTWSLTSWLSEEVPAPGAFSMEWDPNRLELVIKRRSVTFWTSGPITWNYEDHHELSKIYDRFENFDLVGGPLDYTLINVSNVDENYLMFTAKGSKYNFLHFQPEGNFSSLQLQFDGTIFDAAPSSSPIQGLCAGNRTKDGCKRWEGPKCRGNGDRLELRLGYFPGSSRVDSNASLGIGDCEDICWKNCQCGGISKPEYTNLNGTGCTFWFGDFIQDLSGQFQSQHYIIVHGSYSGKRKWIWIIVSVAVVVLIMATIFWYLRRRRLRVREKFLNDLMTLDARDDIHELKIDENKGHNLKLYSSATMMAATNSFSVKNKLGQGGFGPVYKGKLPDGQKIAIKRLSRCSGQGLVEFKNELVLIAKLQHMNLVRLLGCCIQGEEKMLVYEFMPNKSLDFYIFDRSKRELLDWKKRFEIIEGIAQGLLYLHKYSRLRIIHRDLKASNILLDENMNPKISDFGMARIFKINEQEANTNRIVGTYGYMSPEYAMEGIFSVKSDVFSFGVLMLEIVGGRKNRDLVHIDPPLNLVGYAWELWKEANQFEVVDPTLRDSCFKDQVLRCIHVGLLCVEDNAMDRPTMSDVIFMLTSEAPLPLPKQPAFSNARNMVDTELNASRAGNSSINNVSMSTMEAR